VPLITDPLISPLVISAPFGNYLQPVNTTPTLGTFTAARRGGRAAALGRAALTLRYYRKLDAWVNKIGLRNPGIDAINTGPKRVNPVSKSIVSIHGFELEDWVYLLAQLAADPPLAIELNISCPNLSELSWPPRLFLDSVATGVPIIVKLPPIRYHNVALDAAAAGIQWFHASNTLPVRGGGMSGAPLKPLSLQVVRWLRREFGNQAVIIGGGGIRTKQDVAEYASAGANRFAIGTAALRPSTAYSDIWVAEVRAAAERFATGKAGDSTKTPLPR
jgi:dihydroorotate dehydrogenase